MRGFAIGFIFDDHSTWCDFCPASELLRQQLRIAIPTYLVLLYIPTVTRSIVRHRRSKR